MKKKYKHTELSTKICKERGCNKKLKKRLVENKKAENITRCFKCGRNYRLMTQKKKDAEILAKYLSK